MAVFVMTFLAPDLFADVVWPALLLEQKLFGVIPIATGLLAEWLVLLYAFHLGWKRAALIDVSMNLVSSLFGLLLIPVAGLFGVFLGRGIWVYTFGVTVMITTGIEAGVVNWIFKVPVDRRGFYWLLVGNCASVAMAFALMFLRTPRY
jgi:hypothetical protein